MPTVNGFNTTQGILKYNAEKLENYNTPEFSSSTTYSFGDYTIYDGKLYKYTSNTPSSGNWNISNWTFIVLTDEIKTLFNDVNNIENNIPEASDTNPLMDGIVSAGVSDNFSRADHIHPKDTSKQDKLTFDNTPVQNSTNPVTSGGVYTALSEKQDTLTFDNAPIEDSDNPVKSSGIYESILNLYPIDTASGSIASFPDGADNVSVKALSCAINPVQDLHGYDNPWPAGGGVNLLPAGVAGTFTNNGMTVVSDGKGNYRFYGTATTNSTTIVPLIEEVTLPDTVFMHMLNDSASGQCALVLAYGETQLATPSIGVVNKIIDVSAGAGGKTINSLRFYINNGNTVDITLSPMLCIDNTVKPFSPYANLCPITGHTDADVTRTGKNLLDASNCVDNLFINVNSNIFQTISGASVFYAHVKPNTTYTVSCDKGDRTVIASANALPANNVSLKRVIVNSATLSVPQTFTTQGDETLICFYFNRYAETKPTQPQLELGSTATAYSPYVGTTYPISLGTTVYGGTLDVLTGVLTVDRVIYVFTGNESQYAQVSGNRVAVNINEFTAAGNAVCSDFANVITANNLRYIYIPTSMTPDELRDYMTNHTVQCVYLTATPQTIQLTPTQISTLLGTNNIWHDANGETSVIFRADPTLFVNTKIMQAVSSALNT